MRCFALIIIIINNEIKKKKKNAESIDRSYKFEGVVSQKLDGT